MIPKKIHYCWLSGSKIPFNLMKCMKSWKEVMPEYEVVLWDRARFDTGSVRFVDEACRAGKWAFAADYIRAYALFSEGGVYMDSDVFVRKKFDSFLGYDFFTSVVYNTPVIDEYKTLEQLNPDGTSRIPSGHMPGFGIQAGVLGSVRGHPYLKDCMDYYKDRHFILDDGRYSMDLLASDIYAINAAKYGFRYINEVQHLDENMLILPSSIFAGNLDEVNENTYAIHYGAGSWLESDLRTKIRKVFERLRLDNTIRRLLGKPLKYR